MRRSVIRLIARREIRDLLRDRRTLLIVLGLPAMLYPAFVVVGVAFAASVMDQKTVIGVVGMEHLPAARSHPEALLAGAALAVESDRKWDDPARCRPPTAAPSTPARWMPSWSFPRTWWPASGRGPSRKFASSAARATKRP